jgi:hypothetical protein
MATIELFDAVLCWIPITGEPLSFSSTTTATATATTAASAITRAQISWLDSQFTAADPSVTEELLCSCEALSSSMLPFALAYLERLYRVIEHRGAVAKSGKPNIDAMHTASAMSGIGGDSDGSSSALGMLGSMSVHRDAALSFAGELVDATYYDSRYTDTLCFDVYLY